MWLHKPFITSDGLENILCSYNKEVFSVGHQVMDCAIIKNGHNLNIKIKTCHIT
jgi:hypothetical protein